MGIEDRGGRPRQRRRLGCLTAATGSTIALFLIFLLINLFASRACGFAGDLPPYTPPPDQAEMDRYISDCEQQLNDWRQGQVRYPKTLTIPLNESTTYRASVDIRPGAQQQQSSDANIATANVQVRCGLGARLVPLGSNVAIEDNSDWLLQQFDTPGIIEWHWTIRAKEPNDAKVRLEMRPAVAVRDGGYVVPANVDSSSLTSTYETDIEVQSGMIDRAEAWMTRNWPKVLFIAGSIGAALIGLASWRHKLSRALKGEDDAEPPATREQSPAPAATPPSPPTEGRGRKPSRKARRRGSGSKS